MDWATMTPPELIFRLVVLGVGVVGLIAWLWSRAKPGENVGCLVIAFGAIALTLLVGGIAGPDAVKAFWG
jgi:uncharacterized membrane protein YqiK